MRFVASTLILLKTPCIKGEEGGREGEREGRECERRRDAINAEIRRGRRGSFEKGIAMP